MKKLKLEIPLILPEVPDEKDQCVQELISMLQEQKGLEKVHVSEAADNGVPQLCFHYDPELISMDRVRSIARQTGASITEKIGHKLIGVEGIRHPRQARSIERNLSDLNGMIEASVSASGMVRVEFDRSQLDEATIIKALQKEGLDIPDTAVNAEKYLRSIKETEKPQKDQKSEKKPEHEEGDVEHEYAHGGLFGKNTELIFLEVTNS